MEKKWTDLPGEILTKIFELVDGVNQLKECQLVCKKWNQPAQELIYEEVQLEDSVTTDKFFTTISSTGLLGSLGSLVQQLYIGKEAFKEDHITLIAQHCQHIEDLDLPFHNASVTSMLIKERVENGHFQAVSNLHLSTKSPGETSNNVKSAYAFRDTITWLYIYDGSPTRSPRPKEEFVEMYDNIMEKIQDFKNVKYLKVEVVITRQEEKENLEGKLESYLSAAEFPALTTVYHTPHRTNAIIFEPTTVTATNDDEGIVITEQEQQDLSSVAPMTRVEMFYADNITLNDKSVQYMMHKFPQLEIYSLNSREAT